ncbi:c-type cytochrome [Ramlibacter sp. AN1133]|uniref:c-type cytochrome n=1 Tax=Ramlibacter sp. AN1133 TaxID=3133429 RepID=UPI0030BD7DA3
MKRAAFGLLLALAGVSALAQARHQPPAYEVPGGDARRGRELMGDFGCGNCHAIPGIRGARGNVGPPLTRIGDRVFVAGVLRNTPENLMRWLQHPQQVVPGNGMPEMGITEPQARDIASYLYTLR